MTETTLRGRLGNCGQRRIAPAVEGERGRQVRPDWQWIYAVLKGGDDVGAAEAEEVVEMLARILIHTPDSSPEERLEFFDVWDTLRVGRPYPRAVASAWAAWVRTHLPEFIACGGLSTSFWRAFGTGMAPSEYASPHPFIYAMEAIARARYAGKDVWEALEAVTKSRDTWLMLQAVTCARELGTHTGTTDRAAALMARIGRSNSVNSVVRLKAWQSLIALRGLFRGMTDWRSEKNVGGA